MLLLLFSLLDSKLQSLLSGDDKEQEEISPPSKASIALVNSGSILKQVPKCEREVYRDHFHSSVLLTSRTVTTLSPLLVSDIFTSSSKASTIPCKTIILNRFPLCFSFSFPFNFIICVTSLEFNLLSPINPKGSNPN